MRRGLEDDLLAISPPPEFQDRPALPPPVFRDLSPAPNNPEARTSSNLKVPGKYSAHLAIRDFADKISFNILNEAMIIAALIPGAGTTADFRSQTSTPSCPFSSASSNSNTLSTTTSWEYLSKSNSLTDLRCVRCPTPHPYLPHQNYKTPQSGMRKSISEGQGMMRQAVEPTTIVDTSSSPVLPIRNISSKADQQSKRGHSGDSHIHSNGGSKSNNADADVCYTVPFQCDIYSLPVDSIPPSGNGSNNIGSHLTESYLGSRNNSRRSNRDNLRRGQRNTQASESISAEQSCSTSTCSSNNNNNNSKSLHNIHGGENSRAGETVRGVKIRNSQRQRHSLQTVDTNQGSQAPNALERNNNHSGIAMELEEKSQWSKKRRSKSVEIDHNNSLNHRKSSHQTESDVLCEAESQSKEDGNITKEKRTFGHTLLNLFRRSRPKSIKQSSVVVSNEIHIVSKDTINLCRALPPTPMIPEIAVEAVEVMTCHSPVEVRDFAASIEKVKDCGWYWGPLSSEAAEDLLRGEPDGSFIVRDSSDAHYIFSLTFKLNGLVRHVRIEHDQGNFSFGPLTRFKSATIVDFVEKAVAHSRSGRYLFFLHRRPVLGPMRVQLLHPYSRYRHPRSLQHMCRFVILKYVRRDLLGTLPLPKPLLDYLNTPHYYFEQEELYKRQTP